MIKTINHTVLTETLALAERRDGFWLYDKTQGMNLSMRAKTEQAAFVEALTYYQRRLKHIEKAYYDLKDQVDSFVSQFVEPEEG